MEFLNKPLSESSARLLSAILIGGIIPLGTKWHTFTRMFFEFKITEKDKVKLGKYLGISHKTVSNLLTELVVLRYLEREKTSIYRIDTVLFTIRANNTIVDIRTKFTLRKEN